MFAARCRHYVLLHIMNKEYATTTRNALLRANRFVTTHRNQSVWPPWKVDHINSIVYVRREPYAAGQR